MAAGVAIGGRMAVGLAAFVGDAPGALIAGGTLPGMRQPHHRAAVDPKPQTKSTMRPLAGWCGINQVLETAP